MPILRPECNDHEPWSEEEQAILDEVDPRDVLDRDPYG